MPLHDYMWFTLGMKAWFTIWGPSATMHPIILSRKRKNWFMSNRC